MDPTISLHLDILNLHKRQARANKPTGTWYTKQRFEAKPFENGRNRGRGSPNRHTLSLRFFRINVSRTIVTPAPAGPYIPLFIYNIHLLPR